ncbi:MAG TPA: glycosyltransferase family 1 protein [Gaiellaceae bacterium]|jgi:glycosyltransferase involved in cell wall biosynthesis|nr:glycosyltransferase family 1 protein [Gaiellaceae bacterium]
MRPLVVVDADVLGRQRTGDETYVENLLRELPAAAPDLRLAAVTRKPELVPDGVEPVELPARSQEWRMAVSLSRLLGRLRPALGHFQHSLPLRCPCRAVVTVHDLSFERDREVMGVVDRLVFKTVVPRSARRASAVIAVSERTRADLVELYGVPRERIIVTPHGVDPIFRPDGSAGGGYLLFVGAVQERKNPLAALRAADETGLPLVVAGPPKDAALAAELAGRGASVRGWVEKAELAELYRGAAALVLPTRYEGFGLPVLEAMASGTPVVATPDPALQELAGNAAVYAEPDELAGAVRRALARRGELAAAGLERAVRFSWRETARRTAEVYRRALA